MTTTTQRETLSETLEAAHLAGEDPSSAGYRWIDEQFENGLITQLEARRYEATLE